MQNPLPLQVHGLSAGFPFLLCSWSGSNLVSNKGEASTKMNRLSLTFFFLLFALSPNAQHRIQGYVYDEKGMALPGANVLLVEKKTGVAAAEDGFFKFEDLSPGFYTLYFSFMGFQEKRVVVSLPTSEGALSVQLQVQPVILDGLIITATRAGEKAPFTYTLINKEQLGNRSLGADLPYLLEAAPSVVVTSDAGAGIGYSGLRIRGSDPTRINVTVNGIPINDAESHYVFWVDLPDLASSTNDVQVQRGIGTSTHGAGAFGATINLNSNVLHPNPYAEIAASAGSFGTQKSTVLIGTGFIKSHSTDARNNPQTGFTLDARLSRIVSEGYIDRASTNLNAWYISTAWTGKQESVRLNVFSGKETTYQAWNGVPAQWVEDEKLRRFNVSGTEKPGEPHKNEVDDYRQTHYQLFFNKSLDRRWHAQVAGHYTLGKGFFEQYKADEIRPRYGLEEGACPDTVGACAYDFIRRRWLGNDFYGVVGSLRFEGMGLRWSSTLGGAWNRYDGRHFGELVWGENLKPEELGHRYYQGVGEKSDFNVFLKTQHGFSERFFGSIDLQYRWVSHDISGTDNNRRDITSFAAYHFFNPKAGLFLSINEGLDGYLSVGVGHREPNRDDFTDAPKGAFPRPERMLNTEFGVKGNKSNLIFGLNFFHMYYRDQLILTGSINDVGAPVRRNVPTSYRMGIEMTGRWEPNPVFNLEGNATISRNKIRNFIEYIDDWDNGGQISIEHGKTDIAFSPKTVAFARTNVNLLKNRLLTVSLSGKYVGEQFIDNTSNRNTMLDAYFTSEFQVRYILKPYFLEEISLNLLINNLLDTRYSSNAWTYRYVSSVYDGRPYDPYTRWEGGNVYNLTGFFPQAGRHFLAGVTVNF